MPDAVGGLGIGVTGPGFAQRQSGSALKRRAFEGDGLGSIRTWPAPRTDRSQPMTLATPCSRSRGKTRQRRREMRHCRQRSSPSGVRAGSSWSSIGTVSPGNFLAGASSKVNRLVRQLCANCWRRAGRSLTDRCGSSAMPNLYWHPTSESNTWPCSQVTVPEPATFRPTRRPQRFTGGIFSKHSQGMFSAWTPNLAELARCPAVRPTRAEWPTLRLRRLRVQPADPVLGIAHGVRHSRGGSVLEEAGHRRGRQRCRP
ncbi:hypothetical protein QF030_000747 [Streptomyces rishiriensis]|uniref:Uncharacterized protein n=1 Tax=Streptomyces rishiriensis TaxID=68264 RepID=A0ABU0NHK8_STRRH|nr:hypothetical protein [Streptomyces rishiriensis]